MDTITVAYLERLLLFDTSFVDTTLAKVKGVQSTLSATSLASPNLDDAYDLETKHCR